MNSLQAYPNVSPENPGFLSAATITEQNNTTITPTNKATIRSHSGINAPTIAPGMNSISTGTNKASRLSLCHLSLPLHLLPLSRRHNDTGATSSCCTFVMSLSHSAANDGLPAAFRQGAANATAKMPQGVFGLDILMNDTRQMKRANAGAVRKQAIRDPRLLPRQIDRLRQLRNGQSGPTRTPRIVREVAQHRRGGAAGTVPVGGRTVRRRARARGRVRGACTSGSSGRPSSGTPRGSGRTSGS